MLKRFYLRNYCDFKKCFLACLFLASKIHGARLELQEFMSKIPNLNVNGQELLECEVLVATSLDFEFEMHHPLIPLEALMMKFQLQLTTKYGRDLKVKSLNEVASLLVLQSYFTDCPLLYSPALIAMACLQLAIKTRFGEFENEFCEFLNGFGVEVDEKLKQVGEMIVEGEERPDKQEVKLISKQLE